MRRNAWTPDVPTHGSYDHAQALIPDAAVPASTPWVGLDEMVFKFLDRGLLRAVVRKKYINLFCLLRVRSLGGS